MSKDRAIVLIDDDSDDRDLLEEVLRYINVENKILSFSDGKAALEYLKSTSDQPFLILSDINMPVMDGIELRKEVNANDTLRKKSIPFIFLSTTATAVTVNQAYEMSVQGFFQKPSTVQQLRDLLRLICDYWRGCKHPNS